MRILGTPRRRIFVTAVLATVGGALVVGAIVVLSGIYNVAASIKHFYPTERLIKLALWRSIDTHSTGIEVPSLDDPDLVRLGARHFVAGCQPCHAGPGLEPNPVTGGMYPAPPPLGKNVESWEDKELFWIVRHGLKFTGMPQWAGDRRDDEVWAVVSFIRQLPAMSPAQYAELTGGARVAPFAFVGNGAPTIAACARCHGDAEATPVADPVPALQGQSGAYLLRALEEYASGARQSGMMEPIAVALAPGARKALADEFAAMPPRAPQGGAGLDADLIAAGEQIALTGLPQQNVPPCHVCHSGGKSPHFPRLEGLSAVYIANQIRLFRERVRGGTPFGSIMAPIASRLTAEQAHAVAAYFASQSPVAAEDGETRQ